jgi:hypothetical protein
MTDEQSKAVAKSQSTRVSLQDINDAISSEMCTRADIAFAGFPSSDHPSLKVLTLCLIVMKNGFTVIGKSAPADPQNYDENLGMKFAREDAIRQLWPLMGYELRERLARQ